MEQTTRRKRRIDGYVHEEIKRMIFERLGASQIKAILEKNPKISNSDIPHIRTIQSIVRDYPPEPDPDTSETSTEWTSSDSSPDEAAFGLELLRHISGGIGLDTRASGRLSKKEVYWFSHVRRLAPYLDIEKAYIVAFLYRMREQQHADLLSLDVFLSFHARSDEDVERRPELQNQYRGLVNSNNIPNVGVDYLWMTEDEIISGVLTRFPVLSKYEEGDDEGAHTPKE